MVLSHLFLAIIVFIIGVILVFLGIFYLMVHNRSFENKKEGESKSMLGESIGFILVGPIPIIFRSKGRNIRSVLIPIIITTALVIAFLMVLALALISIG
jgi:uncharacterized membrane protein